MMNNWKLEHSVSLLDVFKEMRRTRYICDVGLRIGDQEFPAHRLILAASSDYFVNLFQQDEQPYNSAVEIKGMEPKIVQICLDYMYTGGACLTIANVREVLKAASFFQLHKLKEMCCDFLKNSITIANCIQVAEIAKNFNHGQLSLAAERFSLQNFELVIRVEGFQNLTIHAVSEYMRKLMDYEQKWAAAVTWVKSDFLGRSADFPQLLVIVISDCPFDFLFYTIWNENPIINIHGCGQLVAEAIFTELLPSSLTEDNCFNLLEIGYSFPEQCDSEKLQTVRDFVAANFDTIRNKDGFRNLGGQDLIKILESSNAKFHSPQKKWESVIIWTKADMCARLPLLRKMIRKINWKQCPFSYILQHVFLDFLVQQSKSCVSVASKYLLSAMGDSDITLHNWFTLLEISIKHDDLFSPKGLEKISSFAAINFAEISTYEYFGRIRFEDLSNLLKRNEVNACTEEIIWKAIVSWVKRDAQNRNDLLPEMFKCTDLTSWSFSFLFNVIYPDVLVQSSPDAADIVAAAFLSVLRQNDINISNHFELLMTAKLYELDCSKKVIHDIRSFISEHYPAITEMGSFMELDIEDIRYIVDTRNFSRFSDDLRWKPIFAWVSSTEERHEFLAELGIKLNMERFSFKFLESKVYTQPYIYEDPACKELCVSALLSKLSYCDIHILNWHMLFDMVKQYERPNARESLEKLRQFLAANFGIIKNNPYFLQLEREEVLSLLNLPEINSATPKDQIEGVLEWIADKENMMDALVAMIASLKLEGYPFSLLLEKLLNEKMIRNSPECMELFLAGIQHVVSLEDLNLENWHALLTKAKRHGKEKYKKIIRVAHTFAATRFSSVADQAVFKDLEVEDVTAILQSPDFCAYEDVKVKSVLAWVGTQEAGRWMELPELLKLVKFEKLKKSFIRKEIYENPMVRRSDKCQQLLIEALVAENGVEPHSGQSRAQKRDRDFLNGDAGANGR